MRREDAHDVSYRTLVALTGGRAEPYRMLRYRTDKVLQDAALRLLQRFDSGSRVLATLILWVIIYFVAFTYYSVKFRPCRAVLCCILLFHSPNGLCFKI